MATPMATRMQQGSAHGMRLFGQGASKATGKRWSGYPDAAAST